MKLLICLFAQMLAAEPIHQRPHKSKVVRKLVSLDEVYNARFNPIGLIAGTVNLNLDIRVADHWTVGPEITYYHHTSPAESSAFSQDFDITVYAFGVRANWFQKPAYMSSFYIGPSLTYNSLNLATKDATNHAVTASVNAILVTGLVGYAWFWQNLNLMLGIGATTGLGNTEIQVKTSTGTTQSTNAVQVLAAEASLGWKF